jgi:Hypervirulence associated proteins TUDOR domain
MIDAKARGHNGSAVAAPTSSGISMRNEFKIGDHVSWNSEAGRVHGTIIRVHTRNFDVKGYTHHASPEAPQYEIKSSKTEHIAFHKGAALTKLGD